MTAAFPLFASSNHRRTSALFSFADMTNHPIIAIEFILKQLLFFLAICIPSPSVFTDRLGGVCNDFLIQKKYYIQGLIFTLYHWMVSSVSVRSRPKASFRTRLPNGDFLNLTVWEGKTDPTAEVISAQIRHRSGDLWETIGKLAAYRTHDGNYSQLPER